MRNIEIEGIGLDFKKPKNKEVLIFIGELLPKIINSLVSDRISTGKLTFPLLEPLEKTFPDDWLNDPLEVNIKYKIECVNK